jgi:hypothetical protein
VRVRFGAVAIAAIALASFAACGGSDAGTGVGEGGAKEGEATGGRGECERLESESAREDCERAEAAANIPTADRIAYYQLATTTGLVRAASVAALSGDPRPLKAGADELTAARARLARSSPRDPGLRAARRRLLAMLRGAAGEPSRREAGRELAALDQIERRLSSYLQREPANASLLPD